MKTLRLALPLALSWLFLFAPSTPAQEKIPRVAVITTVWHPNSHADVIGGRLLEGYNLNGQGEFPKLKLVSIFTDQVPENDKSRALAEKHKIPVFDTIAGALTLGGDKLAVDGVLMIAEHGKYPENDTGSISFPKRRLFGDIVSTFEKTGKVVPVFSDKHLADKWEDVDWFWQTAKKHNIPLMAGSSLPQSWRIPAIDLKKDSAVKEIVVTSYHRLDSYGFHGLEGLQCLAERRKGGETGVKRVRCLEGEEVWKAMDRGEFSAKLLEQAVAKFQDRPLPAGKTIRELPKKPSLFQVEYNDGLKATVVTLDSGLAEWAAAWTNEDGTSEAFLYRLQEDHPFAHFTNLLKGVETMMQTGKPTWSTERTLMTSGLLDALLTSKRDGGKWLDTPYLNIAYKNDYDWREPAPMPPFTPKPPKPVKPAAVKKK
ncbi:hypothetical protein ETAA8_10610 [Anatilimnocola aggregata]|uniref:Uncharacterized protein n=1 Tax=Anatilimnocola aggregata TaxID=2528021 RepID=A0A517Y6X6_9BACT|nr:hypothetical protein [Anatilimnocola aggregata]QDU25989.1 hypothetical protein ETAA8_10610 [Anatilimnocola aggregata]